MCHGLASHKRLRDAICTSVPKSSFLNRFIKNYKTYSLKYKPVIYSYYSRHVLLLSKKRRGKEFKVMKNEKKGTLLLLPLTIWEVICFGEIPRTATCSGTFWWIKWLQLAECHLTVEVLVLNWTCGDCFFFCTSCTRALWQTWVTLCCLND